MKDEERRAWRTNWLRSIQEFADYESQRRLWLDPTSNNSHFSFVEYNCSYFDDLALSGAGYERALSEGLVTAAEVAAIADFHQTAETYRSPTGDYEHGAILADPKWGAVVAAAKQAQAALLRLLEDPDELRLLAEP